MTDTTPFDALDALVQRLREPAAWGTCEHHAPDIQPGDCETRDCHVDPGVYPFVMALWNAGIKCGMTSCQGGGFPHAQLERMIRLHHVDEAYAREAFLTSKRLGLPVLHYHQRYLEEGPQEWVITFLPMDDGEATLKLKREAADALTRVVALCREPSGAMDAHPPHLRWEPPTTVWVSCSCGWKFKQKGPDVSNCATYAARYFAEHVLKAALSALVQQMERNK